MVTTGAPASPQPRMCGPSLCHGWTAEFGKESMQPKWVSTASEPSIAWMSGIHGASVVRKLKGGVESSGSCRS